MAFGWAGEESEERAATPPRSRDGVARSGRNARPSTRTAVASLPPDNELWDVHATARFLKRSVSWVYHRAEDGTLPVKRIKNAGTVRRHILESPLATKPLEHVRSGEQLLQAMEGDYAASTINHVRQFLVGAFNRAREAGKWLGANPAEPVRTRRGTEQVGDILRPEELGPFVAALEPDQRPVSATAILTGLRSYARPFPKSRKQRVVRVPDELVPFLEHALATSRDRGSSRTPTAKCGR